MTRIHYEIAIERPAASVWEVISDFGGVYRYNPNVRKSRLTSGSVDRGVGATRHCDLTFSGASAEERIVGWKDGESFVVEIFDGEKMPPFKGPPHAHVSVRATGTARSTLSGELSYEMKLGPIGWLMDRTLVRSRFGSAFGRFVAGVKHYAETGEEVTEETDLSGSLSSLQKVPASAQTSAPHLVTR